MIPEEEGVYVFNREARSWVKISEDGPWVPKEDGTYLAYFRNHICPGCKAFDRVWEELIEKCVDKLHAVPALVQCRNFFFDCSDRTASDTFLLFLVNATPQVIVMVVEGGELRYVERCYGFEIESVEDLLAFANEARERMRKYAEEGEAESEEESGEELVVEGGNWKEVVEKLRKLLLEGRNVREVCDERGCRFVVE
ncbi:MAG: hypothetical protein GXO32_07205 [Crenarchaeota archaeon]|nr:hypothetical protein [Thermoproteota archaeon]